jgi:hypothetical protein
MYTSENLLAPDEISFDNTQHELTIKKKWYDYGRILQLSIALLLNFIIGFIVFNLVNYDTMSKLLTVGVIAVCIIAFTFQAIALWLLYQAICGLFNTTVIKVDQSSISIQYQPFPWFGEKKINRDDILQLHICEKDYSDADIKHVLYQVQVIVKNSDPVLLLRNLETPEVARLIEEKIENCLFNGEKRFSKAPLL